MYASKSGYDCIAQPSIRTEQEAMMAVQVEIFMGFLQLLPAVHTTNPFFTTDRLSAQG